MATGDSRRGRRDNGLEASAYASAGDVDPRVGEHLLDVLALHGIAAYLHPSTDQHPITRSSTLPARPTDRLYVDRVHLETAQAYLANLAEDESALPTDPVRPAGEPSAGTESAVSESAVSEPAVTTEPTGTEPTGSEPTGSGPGAARTASPDPTGATPPRPGTQADAGTPPRPGTQADAGTPPRPGTRAEPGEEYDTQDLEDAWSKIIAGFDDEVEPPLRSWPAAEDVPAAEEHSTLRWRVEPGPAVARRTGSTDTGTSRDEPSLLDGLDTFGADLPDLDEEGYTPPPAPPVPRPSLPTGLGIAGIVGGLIVFLQPDLLPIGEATSMLLGSIAMVAGFAALVWRLRPGDDDDDLDPDDGARV